MTKKQIEDFISRNKDLRVVATFPNDKFPFEITLGEMIKLFYRKDPAPWQIEFLSALFTKGRAISPGGGEYVLNPIKF